jgi:hypothetical protein
MGAEQPKVNHLCTRTHTNDPRYGGLVYLSPQTGTVYQQLALEEKNMPALMELIGKRRAMVHPHLLTVRNHFWKGEKKKGFASCGEESKI